MNDDMPEIQALDKALAQVTEMQDAGHPVPDEMDAVMRHLEKQLGIYFVTNGEHDTLSEVLNAIAVCVIDDLMPKFVKMINDEYERFIAKH